MPTENTQNIMLCNRYQGVEGVVDATGSLKDKESCEMSVQSSEDLQRMVED
jgi:hypothetical protein